MRKQKVYPRYFIFSKKAKQHDEKIWMIYAVVKEKNGIIYYLHKNGTFGSSTIMCDNSKHDSREKRAESLEKRGKWNEIKAAELALII